MPRVFDTSVRVANTKEGYSVTIEAVSTDNKIVVSETKVFNDLNDLSSLMNSVISAFKQKEKEINE